MYSNEKCDCLYINTVKKSKYILHQKLLTGTTTGGHPKQIFYGILI